MVNSKPSSASKYSNLIQYRIYSGHIGNGIFWKYIFCIKHISLKDFFLLRTLHHALAGKIPVGLNATGERLLSLMASGFDHSDSLSTSRQAQASMRINSFLASPTRSTCSTRLTRSMKRLMHSKMHSTRSTSSMRSTRLTSLTRSMTCSTRLSPRRACVPRRARRPRRA